MKKDDSVVKSFRTTETQFEMANEIFKKEGFTFSEVIRLLLESTIKEGRVPRALSNRDVESKQDDAMMRESYIDSVLSMIGVVPTKKASMSMEERLLQTIFGTDRKSENMSNVSLRDWGKRWGFPEDLSIATLADLHDCGLLPEDPWDGEYDTSVMPYTGNEMTESALENTLILMQCEQNLTDHLMAMTRKMRISAMKELMRSYDRELDMKGIEGGDCDEE